MSWDGHRRNVEIGWVAAATAAALLVWTWVIPSDTGDAPYIWVPFWAIGGLGAAFSFPARLRTTGLGLMLGTLAALVLIVILVVIMMASIGES